MTQGILSGSAACMLWVWGALCEPSICSCNRNLMCLGWIERQVLCSSLGQVCMWEQSVWNLLTQLVLHAALKCWCCGAGFCSFPIPWAKRWTDWIIPASVLSLGLLVSGSGWISGISEAQAPWDLGASLSSCPTSSAGGPGRDAAVPELGSLCLLAWRTQPDRQCWKDSVGIYHFLSIPNTWLQLLRLPLCEINQNLQLWGHFRTIYFP